MDEKDFCTLVARLFEKHGAEWNQQVWAEMLERERQREERRKRGEKWRRD
jgi:hypothetical protein